ncbi:DUF4232 domain-containing protein [Streptomyces sp. DH12]|uniref:DUF4232 domain-containing protein n=1 Tax=Streptomyces sp. DH12 TaxID=2857010 RepID=UPI00226C392F|nr:DUF4232 domain-containing protein [Streptomyces sp. DH12]
MRTSTTAHTSRVRRTAIATALLAAALSTSACGITEVSKDPASAAPAGNAVTAPAPSTTHSSPGAAATGTTGTTGTAGATGTTGGSATGGSGTPGTAVSSAPAAGGATADRQTTGGTPTAHRPNGGKTASAAVATCTGANTRVVVQRPARPINRLLLTATNKSSSPCDLYAAPYLRFDQDHAATAVDEATRPHSVIRLAPGRSAYASVMLMGERTGGEVNGRTASRLGVHFANANGTGSTGPSVQLTLPSGTYLTDDARVTYWTESFEDATSY